MFCQKCGNQLKENTKFCPNCGEEITSLLGQNLSTQVEKAFLPGWKCFRCGEYNKGEMEKCAHCGEVKSSHCKNWSNSIITEYGKGTRGWLIYNFVISIIGIFLVTFTLDSIMESYMGRKYEALLYALDIDSLANGWIWIFYVFSIFGYFILFKYENKVGFILIICKLPLAVLYMNSIFANSNRSVFAMFSDKPINSMFLILSFFANELITFLLIKKYWKYMDGPKELINRFSK